MFRSNHPCLRLGKLAAEAAVLGSIGCGAASPTSGTDTPATVRVAEAEAEAEPVPDDLDGVPAEPQCTPSVRPPKPINPVSEVVAAPGDPLKGQFTLEQAIRGLAGRWPLEAEIETDYGTISCELWDQVAPITVANFVGLARGLRPFRDPVAGDAWVTRPAYDGTTIHRVIPGFVIQGGDPRGTGAGDAGYTIPEEIDPSISADRRGILYMAHRGPNTGSMQFFILDGPAPQVQGGYTAFGECGPSSVIEAIARVPTTARDRPDQPVTIRRVMISLSRGCG